jgi:hypothetical protein
MKLSLSVTAGDAYLLFIDLCILSIYFARAWAYGGRNSTEYGLLRASRSTSETNDHQLDYNWPSTTHRGEQVSVVLCGCTLHVIFNKAEE